MADAGVLERIALGLGAVVCTIPFTVLLLKAKGWLCLLAILVPVGGAVAAVVGSVRLAKPNSWWALNIYRDADADRARDRYPGAPTNSATILAALGWINLALTGAIALLYTLGLVSP